MDATHGDELWKSDGTAAGTVLVKDINAGSYGFYLGSLTAVGSTLYFLAFEGADGEELWKSDGTADGTVMVKDIDPGGDGSYPIDLVNAGGTLYFSAYDKADGYELWKSDSTAAGTVLVENINPKNDGAGGDPDSEQGEVGAAGTVNLLVTGGLLFFTDNDGFAGNKPYVLDVPQDVTNQVGVTSSGLTYNRAQEGLFRGLDRRQHQLLGHQRRHPRCPARRPARRHP